MKVVILCGGFGTRIRDVAEDLPKAMIPVGRFPIIWHIMKYYASFGFKDFVLCLGYKGQIIRDYFLNYYSYTGDCTVTLGSTNSVEFHDSRDETNWRVTLAETGLGAMTGARIRKIRQYVGDDEYFFMTYGDGLCNLDLKALLAFHKFRGRILTVTGVRPPGRFGELMTDVDCLATEFNEKPQATAGLISGGFFVCRRGLFDYLDDRDDLVFEQEPMRALVRDRQLAVYEHDDFWQCMDTHRDWQLLNRLVETGRAPWMNW